MLLDSLVDGYRNIWCPIFFTLRLFVAILVVLITVVASKLADSSQRKKGVKQSYMPCTHWGKRSKSL